MASNALDARMILGGSMGQLQRAKGGLHLHPRVCERMRRRRLFLDVLRVRSVALGHADLIGRQRMDQLRHLRRDDGSIGISAVCTLSEKLAYSVRGLHAF